MGTEKRLIDANAFESEISKMFRPYGDGTYPGDYETMIHDETLVDVLETINEAPTVDAVEVVHGRWERKAAYNDGVLNTAACSECKTCQPIGAWDYYPYCPHCGAKMDGDGNV